MAGNQHKRDAKKRRAKAEMNRLDAQQTHASNVASRQAGWEFPSSDVIDKSEVPGNALTDESFSSDYQRNLFFAIVNLISRINDHITRIDSGVYYAIDDLAVSLRVLLREGDGSGILLSAIEEFDLEMPEVLSSFPAFHETLFSVGAIPILEWRPGLKDEEIARGSLKDWLAANVISMGTDDGDVGVSWNRLIGDYANKFGGAHLQKRPPPAYMERMDWYGVAGLALSGYLLRTAAVVAYDIAQSVLSEMVRSIGVPVPETYRWGGMGSQPLEPESMVEMGTLAHFTCNEHAMSFTWFVDEGNPESRLRLFFNQRVWDYAYSKNDGYTAETHLNPVSEYLFQAPKNPKYPPLGPIENFVYDQYYMFLPTVRTWQELDSDIPHQRPDDFHPNLPAPGWVSSTPLKPDEVISNWPEFLAGGQQDESS